MIERTALLGRVRKALSRSPVVALLGPRQCGKTTLARAFVSPASSAYFDLEDPRSLARLTEPATALEGLRGIVVIDEIQRRPDLFPLLRVLSDRRPRPARFLLLGSAAPELLRQSSESLAGRIELVEMGGLALSELGPDELSRRWLRGGFPRSFLSRTAADSVAWREDFVSTLLERDLPQLGVSIPAVALRRFLTMLAHVNGQIWNAAHPARSLGISEATARRYLDLLTGAYLVRQLPPWHENLGKRQVKMPKVYLRDTGLLHALLGLATERDLLSHPGSGASWEGLVIEEILSGVPKGEGFFWATHQGAELDLLLMRGGRRIGVEVKRADAPSLTKSMRIALEDLSLDALSVVYPGPDRYALSERVEVVPIADLARRGLAALEGSPPVRRRRSGA